MCLIAFAHAAHPRFDFVLIGNRDEFHGRPTAPAGPHADAPHVIGGRDLEKGGSWLLVSQHGRLAAVTNVRAGPVVEAAPRSRGALVDGFARSDDGASAFVDGLRETAAEHGRFNLVVWDGASTHVATNHPQFLRQAIVPGVHGLSNGGFDADWPKVRKARNALASWLDAGDDDVEPLFAALRDEHPAVDADLPDTGVGLALERRLSPPFVRDTAYGTRASTVVLVTRETVMLHERRFGPDALVQGESNLRLPRLR